MKKELENKAWSLSQENEWLKEDKKELEKEYKENCSIDLKEKINYLENQINRNKREVDLIFKEIEKVSTK